MVKLRYSHEFYISCARVERFTHPYALRFTAAGFCYRPVTLARELQVPRTVPFSFIEIQHSLFLLLFSLKNERSFDKNKFSLKPRQILREIHVGLIRMKRLKKLL